MKDGKDNNTGFDLLVDSTIQDALKDYIARVKINAINDLNRIKSSDKNAMIVIQSGNNWVNGCEGTRTIRFKDINKIYLDDDGNICIIIDY